jgi:hypothetical protein
MENIAEMWYCLVPFLMQGGPFGVLVLIPSNRVVMFFNGISERIPCRFDYKYYIFLYGPLLKESIPLVLNMGDDLEDCKSNLFPIEKIVYQKNPSSRFNHLSTTSTSISPSNNGISKFTCTLKGLHGFLMKLLLLWAVAEGSMQICPSFCSFVMEGIPRATF